MIRMSPEELRNIQQRIAAQSKVYTHRMRDEPVNEVEPAPRHGPPRKNGRPRLEDEPRPKRSRKLAIQPESVVLRECMEVLDRHPRVAFAFRQNTGAMKMDNGRYVKFSFVGCSDLLACSTAGRWIAVECKRTGGKPTEDQQAFLDAVNKAGGMGLCCDHAAKLLTALQAL